MSSIIVPAPKITQIEPERTSVTTPKNSASFHGDWTNKTYCDELRTHTSLLEHAKPLVIPIECGRGS